MLRSTRGYQLAAELRWQLHNFWAVALLAPTYTQACRQCAMFIVFLLGRRLGLRIDRKFTMVGAYGRLVVQDHSEMLVIREVFVDGTYDHPDLPDAVDLVLDVGCNVGVASLWFARRYPSAVVVAVEANPRIAALAVHNLRMLDNVRVLTAAVSDRPGYTTLWPAPESWASTTVRSDGVDGLRVPTALLDDLLEAGGPRRLLKIDIEGAEHAVFRGSQRLKEFEFITGEYHPTKDESWEALAASLDGFQINVGPLAADGRRTFTARRDLG